MNLVYSYGVPTQFGIGGREAMELQFSQARLLWNALVRADHTCRRDQWALLRAVPPLPVTIPADGEGEGAAPRGARRAKRQDQTVTVSVAAADDALTAAEAAIEAFYDQWSGVRGEARRDIQLSAADKERLDALRAAEAEARTVLFHAAKSAKAECAEAWAARDEARMEQERQAAQEAAANGLFWCNVDEVRHTRYAPARKRVNKHGILMWRRGCRYQLRYQQEDDASGAIAVRLRFASPGSAGWQHPQWADLWSPESPTADWLRLENVKPLRGGKATAARAHLRVGSVGRAPLTCSVPAVIHRVPPLDARIPMARLCRRQVARRMVYSLQLSLQVPEPAPRSGLVCGIDLNWRSWRSPGADGSLRVATVAGEDGGACTHLHLPARILEMDRRLRNLRSRRDEEFNIARDRLANWLDTRTDLPDWLRAVRDGIPEQRDAEGRITQRREFGLRQWRSPERLAKVVRHWRYNRFPGDAEEFGRLECLHHPGMDGQEADGTPAPLPEKQCPLRTKPEHDAATCPRCGGHRLYGRREWRNHDAHLWDWRENLSRHLLDARRYLYQNWAADVCKRYAVVCIEEMRIDRMAQYRRPDDPARELSQPARHARTVAALSELRLILRSAAAQRGVRVVEVPAAGTTLRHLPCGHDDTGVDFAASAVVRCPFCEVEFDQDENAAQAILERGMDLASQEAGV